mgnify:CR=1 FL=1
MCVRNSFGFFILWDAITGVLMSMVRNLGISKILLFFPTLSDQYKICPFDVSLIVIAIVIITNEKITNDNEHNKRSNKRFKVFLFNLKNYMSFFLVVL